MNAEGCETKTEESTGGQSGCSKVLERDVATTNGATTSTDTIRETGGSSNNCNLTQCMDCLRLFKFIGMIREKVLTDKEEDIHNVLDDAKVKFKLFMGHQLRCQV